MNKCEDYIDDLYQILITQLDKSKFLQGFYDCINDDKEGNMNRYESANKNESYENGYQESIKYRDKLSLHCRTLLMVYVGIKNRKEQVL